MNLTVLGGSAAGGNTGAGCSAYLVESGDTRLLLDCGPGTLHELRRHTDFRKLTGIIVSHWHLDHVLDLGALRFALAYNPVKATGKIPLHLPPGAETQLLTFAAAFAIDVTPEEFFGAHFDVRTYDPALSLTAGSLSLQFLPTVHYVPCWAMRVSAGDPRQDLVYTADTGPAADIASFAKGARVLLSEATFLVPNHLPYDKRGHVTGGEAGAIAQEAGVGTLVLTHIWEEFGHDAIRAAAAATFAGRIEVARPGLRVSW